LTFPKAGKPATKCPPSFTIFPENEISRLFIEKTSEKLEKFDFLSQEIKIKNLKKLVIQVCFLTFFETGYIPLLIFK
jgi:hypothetical protein